MIPEMPEGFTDRSAWDAIHWKPSENGSFIDDAVIAWQRDNQERVRAAIAAREAIKEIDGGGLESDRKSGENCGLKWCNTDHSNEGVYSILYGHHAEDCFIFLPSGNCDCEGRHLPASFVVRNK